MDKGTIVELGERSSGFIERRAPKDRLFFHADALMEVGFTDLRLGDPVTFVVTESKKGPYATQIRRA